MSCPVPTAPAPQERRGLDVIALVIVLVVAAIVLVMYDVRRGTRRPAKVVPPASTERQGFDPPAAKKRR